MNSYLNRINLYYKINSPASCTPLLFKLCLQVKESSTAATGSSTVSTGVIIVNSCMSNHTMNLVQYGFILPISIHVFIVYNTSEHIQHSCMSEVSAQIITEMENQWQGKGGIITRTNRVLHEYQRWRSVRVINSNCTDSLAIRLIEKILQCIHWFKSWHVYKSEARALKAATWGSM
jgi:hypothetical protein